MSSVRDTTSVTYNPVIQIFVQFTWVNVTCVQIEFGTLLAAKSNLLRHQTITFHRKLSDLSRVRDNTSVIYNPVIQLFVQFTSINGTLCPNWFWNTSGCQIESSEASNYYISSKIVRFEQCPRHYFRNLSLRNSNFCPIYLAEWYLVSKLVLEHFWLPNRIL